MLFASVISASHNKSLPELYDEKSSSSLHIMLEEDEPRDNEDAERADDVLRGYRINFYLIEMAMLERINKHIIAGTWQWTLSGKAKQQQLEKDILKKLIEGIDHLIEDYNTDNSITAKKNIPTTTDKKTLQPPPPKAKQDDSPFTATYVGGNSAPTIEVFNDSDRTMYFDFGQGKMTPVRNC